MSTLAVGTDNFLAFSPAMSKPKELRIRTGERFVQDKIRSQLPLLLWRVEAAGTRLRVLTPITIRVRFEDNLVFAENETLRIFAHGNTQDEAMEQFQQHVVHSQRSYAGLRDDQVLGDAIRLRRLFAELFVEE